MPAATDIANAIADRLWVLFELQPTITNVVYPANRDKGTEEGWLRKWLSGMRAPADARRLEISFGRFENSLISRRTGFGLEEDQFDTNDNDDFDVIRRHEVVITYREPWPQDPGANAMKEALEQTLFLAHTTQYMGLPDLRARLGEITGEVRPVQTGDRPPTGRVTTIRVFVTTTQSARALVAQTV